MKSGFEIRWTTHALLELEETFKQIEELWTEKELHNLSVAIEQKVKLISQNPFLFQASDEGNQVRRAVVSRLNSIYYRINGDQIEIVSFFLNRRNPGSKNID